MNSTYDPPTSSRLDNDNTHLKHEIEAAKGDMAKVIQGVGERGDRTNYLADRAGNLRDQTNLFNKKASSLRRAECIKEYKWRFIVGLGIIALIALIVIPIAVTQSKNK